MSFCGSGCVNLPQVSSKNTEPLLHSLEADLPYTTGGDLGLVAAGPAQVLGPLSWQRTVRDLEAGGRLVSVAVPRRAVHRRQIPGIRAPGLAPILGPGPLLSAGRLARRQRSGAGEGGAPASHRLGGAVRPPTGRSAIGGRLPVLAGVPSRQGDSLPLAPRTIWNRSALPRSRRSV